MKEKIINYIETLEAKAYQSDDYFKQRNELYIENQKKAELISSLRKHLIEEHKQKENIIKEVREILKFHLSNPSGTKNGWHIDIWNSEDISRLDKDLEILDKENK